jgi:hypothetical protein
VDTCVALGWVPWVFTFDNMKTVTTGRDAQGQAVWHPALLQLAAEFGFHPEACTPGAGNQKGSVESLVKWVKGNFLAGRVFADDTDLARQCTEWLAFANARPSQATEVAPNDRLAEEASRGGRLPATARGGDYGFLHAAQVSLEALVPVLGNEYSVPLVHVGAPVTVRVHRARIGIWRDGELLAEHERRPDGAHHRVVEPAHYALLFKKKPRAQVMLYRDALVQLGGDAPWYVSELCRRHRATMGDEILRHYALYQQYGATLLGVAMTYAIERSTYDATYLECLLAWPGWPGRPAPTVPPVGTGHPPALASEASFPRQAEVDRALHSYERYVQPNPTTPPTAGADPGAPVTTSPRPEAGR